MEVVSPNGLKPLLAFTAIRLEYGWAQTPITSNKLRGLKWRELRERQLEEATKSGSSGNRVGLQYLLERPG